MMINFIDTLFKGISCLFLFSLSICHADYQYELSVCAIFQNEASYLKEWIEFYRLMGVEHFYLYNNQSQDHYREVLKPYISAGLVELIDKTAPATNLKSFNSLQCACYTECLVQSRGISKWVAFLDIDEFLFSTRVKDLKKALQEYEEFGGLGVNWLMFGTSHIWQIPPDQLLIESLILCTNKNFPGNRYIKSIVRPERASHFTNPHLPTYLKNYFEVNSDKLPIERERSDYVQFNKFHLNHYWTRDGHYFYQQKLPRHKRWRGTPTLEAIKNLMKIINAEQDKTILRFLPALKKAMDTSVHSTFKKQAKLLEFLDEQTLMLIT